MMMSTAKSGAFVPSLFKYVVIGAAVMFLFAASSFADWYEDADNLGTRVVEEWTGIFNRIIWHVEEDQLMDKDYYNRRVVIENNNITFDMNGKILENSSFDGMPAILINNKTGVTIKNGEARGGFEYAVKIYKGGYHTIENMRSADNRYAIHCYDSDDNTIDGFWAHQAEAAFYFESCKRTYMQGFETTANYYGIYDYNSDYPTINNCELNDNGADGLYWRNVDDAEMYQTHANVNRRNGFYIRSGSGRNFSWRCGAIENLQNGLKVSSSCYQNRFVRFIGIDNDDEELGYSDLDDPNYQGTNKYYICEFDIIN